MGFARKVADSVAFMDAGSVVETGPATEVLDHPRHTRTRNLGRVLHHPAHRADIQEG